MNRVSRFALALALTLAPAAPTAFALGGAQAQTSSSSSAVARNRELGRLFVTELFNAKDPATFKRLLDRVVAENYIQHNPLVPQGRAGLAGFIPTVRASFPDLKLTLDDLVATEDKVIARSTLTGTHTGTAFLGLAPSGNKFSIGIIDIWTVKDGQLYEHWDQIDFLGMLLQLKAPGLPPALVGR